MADVKKCDFCGEIADNFGEQSYFISSYETKLDLCPSCYDRLENFIKSRGDREKTWRFNFDKFEKDLTGGS